MIFCMPTGIGRQGLTLAGRSCVLGLLPLSMILRRAEPIKSLIIFRDIFIRVYGSGVWASRACSSPVFILGAHMRCCRPSGSLPVRCRSIRCRKPMFLPYCLRQAARRVGRLIAEAGRRRDRKGRGVRTAQKVRGVRVLLLAPVSDQVRRQGQARLWDRVRKERRR